MTRRTSRAAAGIFVASALAGLSCGVPKQPGFDEVAKVTTARTGHRIFWNQGGEADRQVEALVRAMVAHPLSVAEAVQIALLRNQRLEQVYEELTIGQADLVAAGLLKNPTLSGEVRIPVGGTQGGSDYDIHIEQDFLSLLLVPARRRIAKAAFAAAKLRVAAEVVNAAYEVRAAYFTLQAAEQIVGVERVVLSGAEASLETARKQHEAGNIGDLELAMEESAYAEARTSFARTQGEVLGLREKLTRLMGLWGPNANYRIAPGLPDLPAAEASVAHVESVAVANRLDLAAAREELQARAYATAMAKNWRFLGGATVGGHYEREPDGHFLGPTASVELPIFDQRQADIARLEAQERQARARVEELAVAVRSEAREARGRVEAARSLVDYYRKTVIPTRERLVALTLVHYNAMLTGVYQVLAAKQAEAAAYREGIEALRDYWVARADLDRAAGGRLVGGQAHRQGVEAGGAPRAPANSRDGVAPARSEASPPGATGR